jgi:hypothetical protein
MTFKVTHFKVPARAPKGSPTPAASSPPAAKEAGWKPGSTKSKVVKPAARAAPNSARTPLQSSAGSSKPATKSFPVGPEVEQQIYGARLSAEDESVMRTHLSKLEPQDSRRETLLKLVSEPGVKFAGVADVLRVAQDHEYDPGFLGKLKAISTQWAKETDPLNREQILRTLEAFSSSPDSVLALTRSTTYQQGGQVAQLRWLKLSSEPTNWFPGQLPTELQHLNETTKICIQEIELGLRGDDATNGGPQFRALVAGEGFGHLSPYLQQQVLGNLREQSRGTLPRQIIGRYEDLLRLPNFASAPESKKKDAIYHAPFNDGDAQEWFSKLLKEKPRPGLPW